MAKLPPLNFLERMTLWDRNGGICEAGYTGICTGESQEAHHRQRRGVGTNNLSNLGALCSACHNHITHKSPAKGRETGVVVSAYADDPATVPMLLNTPQGRVWVLLDDHGGWEAVTA